MSVPLHLHYNSFAIFSITRLNTSCAKQNKSFFTLCFTFDFCLICVLYSCLCFTQSEMNKAIKKSSGDKRFFMFNSNKIFIEKIQIIQQKKKKVMKIFEINIFQWILKLERIRLLVHAKQLIGSITVKVECTLPTAVRHDLSVCVRATNFFSLHFYLFVFSLNLNRNLNNCVCC